MGFRQDILKKMAIDRLAATVAASIKPVGSSRKIDRTAMRKLMALSDFEPRKERDLELYVNQGGGAGERILVLDNDLGLYTTSVEDVVLRKSPTVKEMISVRNALKILNDGDVLKSKKADTLSALKAEMLGSLNLKFTEADLDSILDSIKAAMKSGDVEKACQGIEIFAEILGYVPAPAVFEIRSHSSWGRLTPGKDKSSHFGPMILFNEEWDTTNVYENSLSSSDPDLVRTLERIAAGNKAGILKKDEALAFLKSEALAATYPRQDDLPGSPG